MNTNHHRGLYRSTNQSMIGGVAAGIADNLNTDPTLIRVIFLIVAFLGGGGILIYCILWIALPGRPSPLRNNPYSEDHLNKQGETMKGEPTIEFQQKNDDNFKPDPKKIDTNKSSLILGVVLITIGSLFLISRIIPRIDFINFWPVLLLVVGIVMIVMGFKDRAKKQS